MVPHKYVAIEINRSNFWKTIIVKSIEKAMKAITENTHTCNETV